MAFSELLYNSFWLIVVGVVWGCTTPLMKVGSAGYEKMDELEKKDAKPTYVKSARPRKAIG